MMYVRNSARKEKEKMKMTDGLRLYQAGMVRKVRTVGVEDYGRIGTWVDVDVAGGRVSVPFELNQNVKENDLVRIVSQCRDRNGELFSDAVALEVVENVDADFEELLVSPRVEGLVSADLESYGVMNTNRTRSVSKYRLNVFFFGGHTSVNVRENEDPRRYKPFDGVRWKPIRFTVEIQTRRQKTAEGVRSYDVLVLSEPLPLRDKKPAPAKQ